MGILNDIVGALYKASRTMGKAASVANTVKTVASGDPSKIAKHLARKTVYKTGNNIANKVAKKIK